MQTVQRRIGRIEPEDMVIDSRRQGLYQTRGQNESWQKDGRERDETDTSTAIGLTGRCQWPRRKETSIQLNQDLDGVSV